MPAEVSTCGAKTTEGLFSLMYNVISSRDTGLKGAWKFSKVGEALKTLTFDVIFPLERSDSNDN